MERVDLLIAGGTVITQNEQREMMADGAVAVQGDTILAVGPADDLREVRANVFAAAFLMPEEGLEEYFSEAGLLDDEDTTIARLSPADIVQAMDHFGASREALLYRLQNAGFMDEETAEELRREAFSVTAVAEALDLTFRGAGPFGTRLRSLALRAWKKGLISTGRAAELLGLDLEEFRDRMAEIGEVQEVSAEETRLGAARER